MKIEWNKVTWYSKILALALFIILPFAGFLLGLHCGMVRQYMADVFSKAKNVSSTTAVAQGEAAYYANVSEWQTSTPYAIKTGASGNFSIAYPIDFTTDDEVVPSPDWRTNSPESDAGTLYFTLTIPKVFEPQTNFDEAKLTVGSSNGGGALRNCLVADPSGGPAAATSTAMINGIDFTVFHFSDAGAGNIYETTSYRTVHGGQCWAIEYTIHSSQIGNYPPEYGLQPFNEATLHDVLDRIAGTFKFQ